MSKVFGKYLVSWENSKDTDNKYVLTGKNRHAKITLNFINEEEFKFISLSSYGYEDYNGVKADALESFPGNTFIKINRAKAILNGAEGARPALNDVALQASIIFRAFKDDLEVAKFSFRLPNYNEWFPLQFTIPNVPYFRGFSIGGKFEFDETLDTAGNPKNYFSLDDYNLQDAYIGGDVFPNLILDVESAGMRDFDGRIL